MGYKLCKSCGQPVLKKGQKRKHPDDYRHAQGCPEQGRDTEGGMRETETLDKLYLEISQFTSAKTRQELELEKSIGNLADALKKIIQTVRDNRTQGVYTDDDWIIQTAVFALRRSGIA
jgi:hypothetical protein